MEAKENGVPMLNKMISHLYRQDTEFSHKDAYFFSSFLSEIWKVLYKENLWV